LGPNGEKLSRGECVFRREKVGFASSGGKKKTPLGGRGGPAHEAGGGGGRRSEGKSIISSSKRIRRDVSSSQPGTLTPLKAVVRDREGRGWIGTGEPHDSEGDRIGR